MEGQWTIRGGRGSNPRLRTYDESDIDVLRATPGPWARAGLITVIILSLAAISYTHQLTPIVGVFALAGLVVFRQITTRWLPVLLALMTLTWMAFGAAPFLELYLGPVLEEIGRIGQTLDENLVPTAQVSPAQVVVSAFSRGLSLLVVVLAAAGVIRRMRHGHKDFPAMLLVAAAVAMLPVSSYGGELLLRIYLFAVPFLAFLAAGLAFPARWVGQGAGAVVLTVGVERPSDGRVCRCLLRQRPPVLLHTR